MTSSTALTLLFEIVLLVGFASTSIRLYTNKLHKRYRVFFAYLVFSFFYTAVVMKLDPRTGYYMQFFVITEPILWLFYVLNVMELYSLVLEKYKGLYTLGRWALYGSLFVSVLVSAIALLPRLAQAPVRQRSTILPYYIMTERGVVCALLVFLFLILVLLSRYPVFLSRNVLVHAAVYSTFFLTATLGTILRSVLGLKVSASLSNIQLGITAFCVLLWLIFVDAKGEIRLMTVSSFAPEQEERILSKLNALNSTVLKAARK
jgi:hypothetical protein